MMIAAVASVIFGSALMAPPEKITAQLKTHEFTQEELDTSAPVRLMFYGLSQINRKLDGYTLPDDFKPTMELPYPINSEKLTVLVQKSQDGKSIAKVWIDWNGNKTAEPSEIALPGKAPKRFGSYLDLKFPEVNKTAHGPVYVEILSYGPDGLGFFNTACAEGTIQVGAEQIQVLLVDLNVDGRYTADGDQIVLRKIEGGKTVVMDQMMPLNAMLTLPDGNYYAASVSKTNDAVTLTPNTSPQGTLRFGTQNVTSLGLTLNNILFNPRVSNGKVSIPSGTYSVNFASLEKVQKDGSRYVCNYYGSPNSQIVVKPNQVTDVKIESPLHLTVTVNDTPKEKTFKLDFTTQSGYRINGIYKLGPKGEYNQLAEPELVITDAAGKVVSTQKFHFG